MYDFNPFVESGALSGKEPTSRFYLSQEADLANLMSKIDEKTKTEVRKHLGEFHTVGDIERYVNHRKAAEKFY